MKNTIVTLTETHYPGFEYPATLISAFLQSSDGLFLLALKNRVVIRYYAEDTRRFQHWLEDHHIRRVN
jgi:hypothetical protein